MPLKNKINLQSTSDLAQVGIQSNSSINSTTIRSSTSITSGIEVSTVADATNKIGIQSNVGIKDPIQVNFTVKSIKIVDSREGLEQTNQWFRDNGEYVNGRPFFVEENYKPSSLVECSANCGKNNTAVNTQTIGNYFDNIEHITTNWIVVNKVYTVFINIPNEQIYRAIRVGTSGQGILSFTTEQPKITLLIGKYFYYNAQTGEKGYDNGSKVSINGNEYELSEIPQQITVIPNNGNIEITNINGRIFIYSISYNTEPVLTYDTKEVAKLEDLDNSIKDFNTEVVKPLSETVQQNSQNINNIQNHIIEIDDDLNTIHTEMGDIQIFQAHNQLPEPSYDYINKIYRLNGILYQCVQTETGKVYNFDFDKVSGSTEINDSNVENIYNEVDPDTPMSNYVTISAINKLFRNNNNGLKFGSSKLTGTADFDMPLDGDLPLTSVKIDIENHSSSKKSHLHISLQGDIDIVLEPSEKLSYSFAPFDMGGGYWFNLETLNTYVITDEGTGGSITLNCDPRVLLHSLQLQYGNNAFEWKQLGGNAGDVLSYEEALDILEPFGITDTSFIVSGSSTINGNTLELGVSAKIDDTKIII